MAEGEKNNPLVSVIIPTYNRAHLIMRAIKSVQAQTFTNWEIVIVDDGSTDDTKRLVESIRQNDPRIFYVKHDKNKGESAARNTGVEYSKGEYIAFIDSDDVWLPLKLEKQIAVFNKGPKDLGIVYTSACFINEATGEKRIKIARDHGHIFEKQVAYNPVGSPSKVMVRSECIIKCGGFDPEFPVNADWDMWTRISKIYAVDTVSEPLVNYFEGYGDSLSLNAKKLVEGYERFWQKYDINSRQKWIRAIHFLRLGHRLSFYGYGKIGRGYLWQAVRVQPLNPKNVILLCMSLFGSKLYRKLTFLYMKASG